MGIVYCLAGYLVCILPFAIMVGRAIHWANPMDEDETP